MLTAEFKVNGRPVGSLTIHNDGSGNSEHGNYDVRLRMTNKPGELRAYIDRWPRERPAWRLVQAALERIDASLKMDARIRP